jgi:two-component system cell cycle response regulator
MPGRILVVDDIETNVRLLEAKLQAEYYQVLAAANGQAALAMAVSERPDVILLDVMMPGMDGFEVCRRLKQDEATSHIPVVLVTALDGRADRITGLEAGADEFLTKPIEDPILLARVKSLTRLKMVIDELRQREATGRRLGMAAAAAKLGGAGGRVLIVDDQERQASRISEELAREHRPIIEPDPERGHLTAKGPVDLAIVNATAKGFDGLRFGAELRAEEATRHLPILGIVDPNDRARLVKALEIGFNDVIARPVDPEELTARVRSLIKGKRYADFLRNHLEHSLELAVTDPLTGLHNRRYMEGQLEALTRRAERGGEPVAALMLDLDHFKHINDSFGHDAGDEVLRVFAVRLASNVRAMDLPCRYGGEEFIVIMPDTGLDDAHRIAERIRKHVAGTPFKVGEGRDLIDVTISIGVAATLGANDTAQALLKRADNAVYEAKAAGRNVVIARAA